MTYTEVNSLMNELATTLKCDYANSAFKSGKRSRFLIFYYENSDDLYADGKNYQGIESLVIEFYSPTKEIESEKTINSILNAYDLAFSKTDAYINSEALHLTTYNTEVIING